MKRLRVLLFAACSAAVLLAQDTVVVLVRHGEKVSEVGDAELSETGLLRAERLVALLAPMKPAALFASDRKRTQQTVAPLARALGLEVQVRKAGEEAALAAHLLEAWKGRTVVACGHSNTVGPLATALGLKSAFAEPKGFDLYWVVRIKGPGLVSLEELRQPDLRPAAR